MSKPGRKPQFRPIPPQSAGGAYRIYYPGRGVISLETSDEREAYTKAGQYAQEYNSAPVSTSNPPEASPTVDTGAFSPPSAQETLAQWSKSTPEPLMPSPSLPSTTPSVSRSPVAQQSFGFSQPSGDTTQTPPPSTGEKVNAVMSPEKRQKIAGLIAKGATLVNIAGTAACVRYLGVIPKLDDEDEAKDVLKIGWELQLEELFMNHPPEPWMVILGGTVAMGFGMYLNGDKIPKKDGKIIPPGSRPEIPDEA